MSTHPGYTGINAVPAIVRQECPNVSESAVLLVLRPNWSSRWPLGSHESLQVGSRVHVNIVVRFGDLNGVGPPYGASRHGLEPVRAAESCEPRWAEGKEHRGRVAEWHTTRDAEGMSSRTNRDGGHVAEQELPRVARPDYLKVRRGRHSASLIEDVHDTQPESGTALV